MYGASSGSIGETGAKSEPALHWYSSALRRWSPHACFSSRARREAQTDWAPRQAHWVVILWTTFGWSRRDGDGRCHRGPAPRTTTASTFLGSMRASCQIRCQGGGLGCSCWTNRKQGGSVPTSPPLRSQRCCHGRRTG